MAERCIGVRVVVTHFISDEPQPGIVGCEFTDAHGRPWAFIEKTATVSIASNEYFDGQTDYPRPGVIMCRVVGRRRAPSGSDVIEVEIEYFPVGVDSDERWIRFDVLPDTLVEWEWGRKNEVAWGGLP